MLFFKGGGLPLTPASSAFGLRCPTLPPPGCGLVPVVASFNLLLGAPANPNDTGRIGLFVSIATIIPLGAAEAV